jgi:ABC-2 type transport system permease protein
MTIDALRAGEASTGVLAVRRRPAPATAASAVLTLAWRAMLKIKHVPFQLFDVTECAVGAPRACIGICCPVSGATVVFICMYTGVGLNTDIQKGLYDRFRSLPCGSQRRCSARSWATCSGAHWRVSSFW